MSPRSMLPWALPLVSHHLGHRNGPSDNVVLDKCITQPRPAEATLHCAVPPSLVRRAPQWTSSSEDNAAAPSIEIAGAISLRSRLATASAHPPCLATMPNRSTTFGGRAVLRQLPPVPSAHRNELCEPLEAVAKRQLSLIAILGVLSPSPSQKIEVGIGHRPRLAIRHFCRPPGRRHLHTKACRFFHRHPPTEVDERLGTENAGRPISPPKRFDHPRLR